MPLPVKFSENANLPYVYLSNGYVDNDIHYVPLITVGESDLLVRAICFWLIEQQRPLDSDEIRFLMKFRNITTDKIKSYFGQSVQVRKGFTEDDILESGIGTDRAIRTLALDSLQEESNLEDCTAKINSLTKDFSLNPDRRPTKMIVEWTSKGWKRGKTEYS